jgi:hypothetical protein
MNARGGMLVKSWLELWVRLKVVDLVTQTVWMTLTEKLDFADDLCGLVHYAYWGMYAEGPDRGSVIEEIDRVIRMDSAFTNQNKHCYRLAFGEPPPPASGPAAADEADVRRPAHAPAGKKADEFANGGTADEFAKGDLALENDFPVEGADRNEGTGAPVFAFDCLIREKRPDREKAFERRLASRLDPAAVSGMRAGEVWRILVRAGDRDDALAKVERMLVTRSRREGLLFNPHYQQCDVISVVCVEGREKVG